MLILKHVITIIWGGPIYAKIDSTALTPAPGSYPHKNLKRKGV